MRALSFAVCLAPSLWLAARWWLGALGVDPLASLLHFTGLWAITMLLVTLSVTPLRRASVWAARQLEIRHGRRVSDWNALIRLRRQFGLFAFYYVALHLLIYALLDAGGELREIARDALDRPFIALGLLVFALLVPLAASSTQAAMRRLKRHWRRLHMLVYPAAVGAIVHDWMQTKLGQPLPLATAALLAGLLLARLLSGRLGDRDAAAEVPVREPGLPRPASSPATAPTTSHWG